MKCNLELTILGGSLLHRSELGSPFKNLLYKVLSWKIYFSKFLSESLNLHNFCCNCLIYASFCCENFKPRSFLLKFLDFRIFLKSGNFLRVKNLLSDKFLCLQESWWNSLADWPTWTSCSRVTLSTATFQCFGPGRAWQEQAWCLKWTRTEPGSLTLGSTSN